MTNIKDFAGEYALDTSHSEVAFISRHAMVTKVRGEFTEFASTITINEDNTGTVTAIIKTDSLNSGNKDRDAHLASADFFDTENYPEITFTTISSDFNNGLKGTITGELTVKGVSKNVVLDVEVLGKEVDPFGNERLGFEATTTINRKDFNIDWNAPLNTGGVLVSEKVKLQIDGSAIKQ